MRKPERILLLGGGGFMGRALGSRLRDCGQDVHILVRGSVLDAPAGVSTHGGGMENTELLRSLLPTIDAIIHLASATTPSLSRATPSLEASLNVGPTLGFLEELQRHPHIRLIYLSSGGAIYGNPGSASATESTPVNPMSYYGAGKLAIEQFLHTFQHIVGNAVTILRPSNLYGPGQPRYQGFGVVRTMLQHVLDGTTMSMWGDGSIVRDFIHIDDVVSAIDAVLADTAANGTFNIGSGVGHSLNDVKLLVEDVSGRKLPIHFEAPRTIDVHRIVLDSSLMAQRFGWRARISLEQGIRETWRWLQSQ